MVVFRRGDGELVVVLFGRHGRHVVRLRLSAVDFQFVRQPRRGQQAYRELFPEEAARKDRQRTEGAQTLMEFFEKYYRPDRLQPEIKNTVDSYLTALRRWECETSRPALSAITDDMLREHLKRLATKLKPASVNKHLRHLRCVLYYAGPRGIGYPGGKDIISHVPYARKITEYRELPQCVEPELIGRLYDACKVAKKPDGWAVQYWRALFVLVVQTGVRVTAAQNISIKDIDWENKILAMRACHAKSKVGELFPLTETTLRHIEPLRRRRGFLNFEISRTMFYREWKRIRTAAGVDPKRKLAFHDIRRTVATEITKISGVEAAMVALGHKQLNTTLSSYINFEKLIEPMNRRPMHFTPAEPAPDPVNPAEVLRQALAKGRLIPGEFKEAMLLCGIQQKESVSADRVAEPESAPAIAAAGELVAGSRSAFECSGGKYHQWRRRSSFQNRRYTIDSFENVYCERDAAARLKPVTPRTALPSNAKSSV